MPDAVPAATQTQTPPVPVETKPPEQTPAPVVETKPETKPEPKPDPMSPRFAALARQTKEIAAAKQELARAKAEQEAAIQKRQAEIEALAAKVQDAEKWRSGFLADPGSALRGLLGDGWYDKLTEYKLSGEKDAPATMAVQAMREEMAAKLAAQEKANEERWRKAEDERRAAEEARKAQIAAEQKQAVDDFQAETVEFIKANPEKYEVINKTEDFETVFKTIEEVFRQTKRVMSPAEAADLVENYRREQAASLYDGGWWKARQAAKAPPPEPAKPTEPARTLTNQAATGASASTIPPDKMDRYARAAAAMEEAMRAAEARQAK